MTFSRKLSTAIVAVVVGVSTFTATGAAFAHGHGSFFASHRFSHGVTNGNSGFYGVGLHGGACPSGPYFNPNPASPYYNPNCY